MLAHACMAQTLPVTRAETLNGEKIDFPTAALGKPAVFVLAFTHTAGDKIHPWMDALTRDGIPSWSAADIEGAPLFVRGMIRSSMRKDTPQSQWDHTLIMSKDSKAWKQTLKVTNDNVPVVVVVSAGGTVIWSIEGVFSVDAYEQLKQKYSAAGSSKN